MDWKSRAQKALEEGYIRRNPWERMFHVHLLRNFPDLVREFQAERQLTSYIITRVNDAMNRATELEEQGTPPEAARELVLSELLQPPPEAPKAWEIEGAQQDILSAVEKHLSNLSPNRPAKTTPPT